MPLCFYHKSFISKASFLSKYHLWGTFTLPDGWQTTSIQPISQQCAVKKTPSFTSGIAGKACPGCADPQSAKHSWWASRVPKLTLREGYFTTLMWTHKERSCFLQQPNMRSITRSINRPNRLSLTLHLTWWTITKMLSIKKEKPFFFT